jgi:hypothetical protein
MLLLEDRRFYVYIYLNPLKPGNYYYLCGNIRAHFDFSPFYVGRGKEDRLYDHLKQVQKIREKIENESLDENEKHNTHKINTINKILRYGKEPIIFKIEENLSNNKVNELEKFYIKLIGRADNGLGPLTNRTDGGEGACGYKQSKEHINKRVIKRKNTYNDNPNILINSAKKHSEFNNKNPEIVKKAIEKGQKTLKENSEIMKNAVIKQKQTKLERYNDENYCNSKKAVNTKKSIPNLLLEAGRKQKETKRKNKTAVGNKNSAYKKLNYKLLIELYFSIISITEMNKLYASKIGNSYGCEKFYKILNFPKNIIRYKTEYEIYLSFVEQNKHKIQWYIDNYEKLEKEYFYKKHKERRNFTNNKEIKEVA